MEIQYILSGLLTNKEKFEFIKIHNRIEEFSINPYSAKELQKNISKWWDLSKELHNVIIERTNAITFFMNRVFE